MEPHRRAFLAGWLTAILISGGTAQVLGASPRYQEELRRTLQLRRAWKARRRRAAAERRQGELERGREMERERERNRPDGAP
jgi:hypothetical protein